LHRCPFLCSQFWQDIVGHIEHSLHASMRYRPHEGLEVVGLPREPAGRGPMKYAPLFALAGHEASMPRR